MTDRNIYSSARWRDETRPAALARDGHRCTVSRLLGGPCSEGPLHVHHIVPLDEGGAEHDLDNVGTTCARHHAMWEALRRVLARRANRPPDEVPPCRALGHIHRYRFSREDCERRRRQRLLQRDRRLAA